MATTVAASLAAAALARTPITWLDFSLYDLRARSSAPTAPSPEIVLVTVDAKTVGALAEPACHYNPHHASAVRAIAEAGARAIGFDVLQPRAYDRLEDENAALGEAFAFARDHGVPVVLAAQVVAPGAGTEGLVELPQAFPGHPVGMANLTVDADEVARRQRLVFPAGGDRPFPSFALALLEESHRAKREDVVATIPDARLGGVYIGYAGPAGTFPRVPLVEVLDAAARKDVAWLKSRFEGRTVLLGEWDLSGPDAHVTPWTVLGNPRFPPMPGIEVHANTLHTLLGGHFRRSTPAAVVVLWLAAMAASIALVAMRSARAGALLGLGLVALSFLAGWIGFGMGFAIPVVAPLLVGFVATGTAAFLRINVVKRNEHRLRDLFGAFVSPEILQKLESEQASGRGIPELGEERILTVLVADIRGFTRACEVRTPWEVMRWLRRYHAAMSDVIRAERGTINKFMGDGIIAIFGAPVPADAAGVPDATRAALAMAARLESLNEEFAAEDLPRTKIGIGIHTGKVIAGVLGTSRRAEYTVIGDTVNVASRIEAESKEMLERPTGESGGKSEIAAVVMSDESLELLKKDRLYDKVKVRFVGDVSIRGRLQSVKLFLVSSRP